MHYNIYIYITHEIYPVTSSSPYAIMYYYVIYFLSLVIYIILVNMVYHLPLEDISRYPLVD